MTITEYSAQLKLELSKRNVSIVVNKLINDLNAHSDIYNQVLLLSSQITDIDSRHIRGEIPGISVNEMKNRVVYQALSIVDLLKFKDFKNGILSSHYQSQTSSNTQLNELSEFTKVVLSDIEIRVKSIEAKIDSIITSNDQLQVPLNDTDFVNECYKLISTDDVRSLFLILLDYFDKNSSTFDDVILLNNRWSKNERGKRTGGLDIKHYSEENNRIIQSILEMLKEL